MAKPYAKKFYNSSAWKTARKSYIDSRLAIDGGLCEECETELGYIVHHKVSLSRVTVNIPELALGHDNFQYVCKECHDKFDGHGTLAKPTPPLARFDVEGNPWPIPGDPPI